VLGEYFKHNDGSFYRIVLFIQSFFRFLPVVFYDIFDYLDEQLSFILKIMIKGRGAYTNLSGYIPDVRQVVTPVRIRFECRFDYLFFCVFYRAALWKDLLSSFLPFIKV